MDFLNAPLLAAAALVFVSILAGLFSARIGFSFLLVFLLAGILAGEDGPGGYRFEDVKLSFWVGNVALGIILLDGGLRTSLSSFRTGLKPASVLATVGVLVCAALTGLAGMLFLGLDWGTAMLLGAIVGSTDAAAVFALLTRSGVTLNERVAATLEIESGANDPMAIYLTLAFIALLAPAQAASGGDAAWASMAWSFVRQFGWGGLFGVLGGLALAELLKRVAGRDTGGGILALMVMAAGLTVFAATGLIGGSGSLAVYRLLVVANRASRPWRRWPRWTATPGWRRPACSCCWGCCHPNGTARLAAAGIGRGAGVDPRGPAADGVVVPGRFASARARPVHRLGGVARRRAHRAGAVPAAGRHAAPDCCSTWPSSSCWCRC